LGRENIETAYCNDNNYDFQDLFWYGFYKYQHQVCNYGSDTIDARMLREIFPEAFLFFRIWFEKAGKMEFNCDCKIGAV